MNHMFEAGISLSSIFRAATYNNAKAFNLEDKYGSVEKGKIANLLILSSNPLETLEAFNQIEQVIIRGEIIERAKLSALSNWDHHKNGKMKLWIGYGKIWAIKKQ